MSTSAMVGFSPKIHFSSDSGFPAGQRTKLGPCSICSFGSLDLSFQSGSTEKACELTIFRVLRVKQTLFILPHFFLALDL